MADKMPAPVLGEDGKIDIEADNAALEVWSKKRTTLTFDNATLEKFINRTEQLLEEIEILKVDETKNKYRFRQENPNLLKKKGYQKVITKKINNHIEFIIYYKNIY